MPRYSYSRAALGLRCGHAHHLAYERGLTPVVDNVSLRRGTLIHAGMEAGILESSRESYDRAADRIRADFDTWKSDPRIEALLDASSELWDESIDTRDTCIAIVHRVLERFQIAEGRWKTLEVDGKPLLEYEMEVETPNYTFSGRLDWVAQDTDSGHRWLIDFKSRKAMQPVEADETNAQMGVYQHLLRTKHGVTINGNCIWQIKAAVPKQPKTNKNGTISRSAVATDWETYSAAVIEAGLDPVDYLDMKEKLQDFDRLNFTYRSATEAEAMWKSVGGVLDAMALGKFPQYRHLNTYNCRNCAYRDHCMAELRGDDVQPLEEHLFRKEET